MGAFFSSYWVDSTIPTWKVGLVLGIVNMVAAAAALTLPETKNSKMH